MRTPKVPDGAITVSRYTEFLDYRDRFFDGHFSLLIVLGGPGRSKSWYFNEAAAQKDEHGNPRAHVIKGYAKPFQVYKQLYWHMDEKIIVDDAELLWMEGSGSGRKLVRQLSELEDPNDVSWTTAVKELDAEGIPGSLRPARRWRSSATSSSSGPGSRTKPFATGRLCCTSIPLRWNSNCGHPTGTGISRYTTTSAAGCMSWRM